MLVTQHNLTKTEGVFWRCLTLLGEMRRAHRPFSFFQMLLYSEAALQTAVALSPV